MKIILGFLDRRWGDCKLCKMLRNPYYAPAAFLARFSVDLATLLWACIVVAGGEDTLGAKIYIYHKQMADVMPIMYWAVIALFSSAFGIYRLFSSSRPAWWGGFGYWMLMLFWVYVDAAIVMVDSTVMSPIGLSGITMVAFLSIYAAASHANYPPHHAISESVR